MLITEEVAQATRISKAVKEAGIKMDLFESGDNLLSKALFFLEHGKDHQSRWASYIKTIPKDWSAYPLFFSEEEREWLTGSIV